jgi:hypothetical protein
MTNPFTHFLKQWSRGNQDLELFIAHWDTLEQLVVQVYRGKQTAVAAKPDFERVWPWLRQHYGAWEAALRPYWQQTRAAGAPTQLDPFALILALDSPEAILGDWHLMQHLPAAREALNRYLRDQSAS